MKVEKWVRMYSMIDEQANKTIKKINAINVKLIMKKLISTQKTTTGSNEKIMRTNEQFNLLRTQN